MRALLVISLFIVPLMFGQQTQQRGFEDCDKRAKTQADLNECGSADAKSADDELNRTYQQLLKKVSGDPIAVEKIRAAQVAWLHFRDAQIAALYPAENKLAEYGTVYPMCVDLDFADLTRQRTKMLKQMLNPVEGDVCGGGLSYPDRDQPAPPTKHR